MTSAQPPGRGRPGAVAGLVALQPQLPDLADLAEDPVHRADRERVQIGWDRRDRLVRAVCIRGELLTAGQVAGHNRRCGKRLHTEVAVKIAVAGDDRIECPAQQRDPLVLGRVVQVVSEVGGRVVVERPDIPGAHAHPHPLLIVARTVSDAIDNSRPRLSALAATVVAMAGIEYVCGDATAPDAEYLAWHRERVRNDFGLGAPQMVTSIDCCGWRT